jgi:hypothetical protein
MPRKHINRPKEIQVIHNSHSVQEIYEEAKEVKRHFDMADSLTKDIRKSRN